MQFTDLFIRKPVLATVVSLLIFLLGLRAAFELTVRQYPEIENAVISVYTVYPGAHAELVQGFVTTPLEQEIASAEGIDYLRSTSLAGASSIEAYVRLGSDPDDVLTQVSAKVNKLRNELPEGSEDPVIELTVGETTAAMYLSFYSEVLDNGQITDYLTRVVEPKLATIPGVQRVQVVGGRTFAMRIWLKPERLTALGVTASDVYESLRRNNVLSAVGSTKGSMVSVGLTADTDLTTAEQFQDLVVRAEDGAIVRLGDVADVMLGAEDYTTSVSRNGQSATLVSIEVAPDANSLDVIDAVLEVRNNDILPQLPEGLEADIAYDTTEYIRNAIRDVVTTLIEAVVIVIVVIFLFLGSVRSVLIPTIAVPLSLVGALFPMLLMGFSINLLTLLAMILAIGIVVDDAIIVLENIHRHVEEGMTPREAAFKGARELAWPVVAMTTTLAAVYLPIGFLGGLTGTLFIEFAFTLTGAVLLSGVIALTLSPMMCATLLKPHTGAGTDKLADWLDRQFAKLAESYRRLLHGALDDKHVIAVFGAIVLVSCYFLFVTSPTELAPEEDQGVIIASAEADPYTTLDYLERYTSQLEDITLSVPEINSVFLLNGMGTSAAVGSNTSIAFSVLDPWGDRERSTQEILNEAVLPQFANIAGIQVGTFTMPPLPSGGFLPIEFVIGTTDNVLNLEEVSRQVLETATASGRFIFLNTDLKIDKPRQDLVIDRDKAALLGIDMRTLSQDLSALLSSGFVNRFEIADRSYKVIPQVQRVDRLNPEQLASYYTRTGTGELVPLATLVTLEQTVEPQQLKRFQQLNSVTISGVARPGVTLGEALEVLEEAAAASMPSGYSIDYAGQSRQFKTEGAQLTLAFFFALIVIYLVLAAQFESFRDPIIMLVTVPMSVCGAMLFVSLGLTTLNIYTQVGLVTLIGVISKHGILIVEFANRLREQGRSRREAIEQAAAIRLRPVLMTTAALVMAMVPLLTASGPGAAARFSMGLVIAAGMTIGTAFTLFVVPAIYLYLAHRETMSQ
ncbi:MAG TPA: efflux RND transporter permease subunit [Gammaproteobacteria bacterium]